jgi:hypothetical protein
VPSVSKKQHNFMAAVANNPAFAKKAGVPQSVGKEFSNADKGRKFSKGGNMKSENMMMKKEGRGMAKADMAKKGMPAALAKHAGMPASKAHKGLKAGGSVGTTKMGAVRTAAPSRDGVASKGKTQGAMIKMARGGKAC